jgi:hypothetical protein
MVDDVGNNVMGGRASEKPRTRFGFDRITKITSDGNSPMVLTIDSIAKGIAAARSEFAAEAGSQLQHGGDG